MAGKSDNSIGSLFLRIGINLSELESDFILAEKSVKENFARLARENQIIKLRAEIEVAGLDPVKDAQKILEVQTKSLNQQIENQKDRLKLTTAAWIETKDRLGENAAQTQKLQVRIEQESAALAKLEQQLRNIGNQKIELDTEKFSMKFAEMKRMIDGNIASLNQKNNIIKMRAEFEMTGLDKFKDNSKILEIQIQSLNQQIKNQQSILKMTEALMMETATRTGQFSAETLKATASVEREKLALSNLMQQLKNIGQQKNQLNVDQINAQFDNMQRTIDAYISKLSQKNTIIKLRTEFETTGLDKAKDASKIFEVQIKSLNQQIKNQQAILRATEKVLNETTAHKGKFSSETMRATANVEHEKLALKRLEAELRRLSNEQQQLNDQQNSQSKNSLLNGYNNIKGNISGKLNEISTAFNGISTASQSADGAITKTLAIIDSIPHPVGKVAAALASIPLVLRGVENSILSYTKTAVAAGDSLYVMSQGMQLSVVEMGKLSTVAKITGIDINEVNSNLRRIEAQFIKSGSSGNVITKMLDKYNIKLADANGNLKKGIELSLALADGLKKAQVEGKGAEFISAVGGKFWSGDFVTYLQDLRDNIDAASKIVKNGLANPALAHQVQGNLNMMDAQVAQLKASFASTFIPVANEIVPRITERMGELTKFIADNKDEIKDFGNAVAGFFGKIEDGADMAFKVIKILHDGLKELRIDKEQKELELSYSFNLNPNIDTISKTLDSHKLSNPTYFAPMLKTLDDVKQQVKEKTNEIIKDVHNTSMTLEIERANNENKNIGFAGAGTASAEREDDHFQERLDAAREYVNKYHALSDELYKITHSEYENKKLDLLNWRQELLNNEETTAEQRTIIEKIYAEKSKQIEQDRQNKIDEIREEIASKNRTDLENQIAAIEKSKNHWIEVGLPNAEAEKAAQEQKLKVIEELEKSFAEARDAIHQTELEKRLAQIEKEKEAWIQKGIDEVKATQLAEQQKVEASKNAAMNVLKSQLKNFRAFRDGGYEALQQRMLADLRKAGISDLDLKINDQQLQDFLRTQKEIQNNFLPNIQGFKNDINTSLNEMIENAKNVNLPLDDQISKIKNNLSEVAPPIANIKEKIAEMSEPMIKLPDLFNELGTSISSLIENLNNIPEFKAMEKFPIENPNQSPVMISDNSVLPEVINSINQSTQQTGEAQRIINEIQNKMVEATSQLAQAISTVEKTDNSLSQLKTTLDKFADIKVSTPTVNITQHVNEPHAWNNELIQELADKVADKMKNEIIYAIKGSYGY